jgi:PAS domain S-box-containing protein
MSRQPPSRTSKNSTRLGKLDPTLLIEHVFDTMPGGLYTVDAAGRLTSWNRAMEVITGYGASEAIGQACSFLQGDNCFGKSCDGKAGLCCPLFDAGSISGKRCRIRRKDGTMVQVVKNAQVMHDAAGKVLGGIEVVTDVTNLAYLENEVAVLRNEAAGRSRHRGLIGRHPSMVHLSEMIELAARSDSSVLIQGETGTGKELVAAAICRASRRADKPFVRVSCAALTETLLESELFGHVRGAFTGAFTTRKGRFEAANGGTLLLDEIGDISPAVQTRLLRVLQEREFERVGDNRTIKVDLRVLAATNRDLFAQTASGAFRSDLYYRLAVLPIRVPPLRERPTDVPLLVEYFVERLNRTLGRAIAGVAPDAMQKLVSYGWPGNVRELENAVEYAFAVERSAVLTLGSLPPVLTQGPSGAPLVRRRTHRRPDRERIAAALQKAAGNRSLAAQALGVSRVTLWKWLRLLDEV